MRWLPYLNLVLVATLICACLLFFLNRPEESDIPSFMPHIPQAELPKSPFVGTGDEDLEGGPFALNWVPPLMQLPDLRQEIQFFGQNGRPDAAQGKTAYHIGLKSSGEYHSIREGERVYLVYQGNYGNSLLERLPQREPLSLIHQPIWGEVSPPNKGSYLFSPGNYPTPLWIETCSKGNGSLSLRVSMLDEKGALVQTPHELRQIALNAQDFPKAQTVGWELGGFRVDTTLLVRQKARWLGSDRFLEMHGGEDFSYATGKERIDFQGSNSLYSCFIGQNDFLIWREDRWVNPKAGERTEGYPLLCVKKIDEKVMTLELWDGGGRAKTALSLIRSKEHNKTPNIAHEFKFVGAKTWAQFIVECGRGGGRLTLKPNDWLVLTTEGWRKIEKPEEVDAYVEGSLNGPLFILDRMGKQNGRQVLFGHLFNVSRTEVEEIMLEACSSNSLANFCRTLPALPPIKPSLEGDEE